MRTISISIKTTSLHVNPDNRIVEIGAFEFDGRSIHYHIDHNATVCRSVEAAMGFNNDSLGGKLTFAGMAPGLLDFVRGSRLLVFNAPFHMGFLNAELGRLKLEPLELTVYCIEDIQQMARIRFGDSEAEFTALCFRYKIDLSRISSNSALDNARLLAHVYHGMTCGSDQ